MARRETDIVRAILDYLKVKRVPAWRVNTGAFKAEYKGRVRFHRFGAPGMSDIIACLPPLGRMLALEVKREDGEASEKQEEFLALVKSNGGVSAVVRSIDDVERLLSRVWGGPHEDTASDSSAIAGG